MPRETKDEKQPRMKSKPSHTAGGGSSNYYLFMSAIVAALALYAFQDSLPGLSLIRKSPAIPTPLIINLREFNFTDACESGCNFKRLESDMKRTMSYGLYGDYKRSTIFAINPLNRYSVQSAISWTRRIDATADDLAIDSETGNIYVCAYSWVDTTMPRNNASLFVNKYSPDGRLIHTSEVIRQDDAYGRFRCTIAVDPSKKTSVVAWVGEIGGRTSPKFKFLVKYNSEGKLIWKVTPAEGVKEIANVAVGDNEEIFTGLMGFPQGSLCKLDGAGQTVWNKLLNASAYTSSKMLYARSAKALYQIVQAGENVPTLYRALSSGNVEFLKKYAAPVQLLGENEDAKLIYLQTKTQFVQFNSSFENEASLVNVCGSNDPLAIAVAQANYAMVICPGEKQWSIEIRFMYIDINPDNWGPPPDRDSLDGPTDTKSIKSDAALSHHTSMFWIALGVILSIMV